MKKPVETLISVQGDGTQINVYENRFRGDLLLTSKRLLTLTHDEADVLVKKLSHEIHYGGTLMARFGGQS